MTDRYGKNGPSANGGWQSHGFLQNGARAISRYGAVILLFTLCSICMYGCDTQDAIALPTPTIPQAATPSATPDPSTPAPTDTPVPTIAPSPTLPLDGEVSVYPAADALWDAPRQATSAPRASMNVRSGPGANEKPIDVMGVGRRVTVFGQQGEWYYIWYAGRFGWAHMDLIRLDDERAARSLAIETEPAEGGVSRLTALPEDPSLYRLVFSPGCAFYDDGDAQYRVRLSMEQCVCFSAQQVASLAIGSLLPVLSAQVEVESLMWERDGAGEAVCLLVNDAYRIAYDAELGSFALVSHADGTLKPQMVASSDVVYEIAFADDAAVMTPDAPLWGDAVPASGAPEGERPAQTISAADFCRRLADCPATSFPPQAVALEMENGLVTRMYWSFAG